MGLVCVNFHQHVLLVISIVSILLLEYYVHSRMHKFYYRRSKPNQKSADVNERERERELFSMTKLRDPNLAISRNSQSGLRVHFIPAFVTLTEKKLLCKERETNFFFHFFLRLRSIHLNF